MNDEEIPEPTPSARMTSWDSDKSPWSSDITLEKYTKVQRSLNQGSRAYVVILGVVAVTIVLIFLR